MPKDGILLAGHGTYPWDFIKKNPRLWSKGEERISLLTAALLDWPRTPKTDPHKFEVERWAQLFKEKGNHEIVEPAFMMTTRPMIIEGVRKAVEQGAEKIVAVPPFFNIGPHTIMDIPKQLERAKKEFPNVEITYYPPPFDPDDVADLMMTILKKFKNPMRW